ncbi:hypothetical protein KR044_007316, partial [Drosophila immigrans]
SVCKMTSVRCINFWDLCRICTASSEQKINIYSPDGRAKNLSVKISECLPVHIDEKDRLPKVVCAQCAQQVEQMYEMRNISKNSQTILSNWLNHRALQNDDKVFIKDAANEAGKSLNVVGQAPSSGQAACGNYQNNDLLSSIMQAVGMQVQQQQLQQQPQPQQYTISVDNHVQAQSVPHIQPEIKIEKQNTLEEFIRLKPDIKITPIGKKESTQISSAQGATTDISQIKQQQTQPQQQPQQQLPVQTLTAVSASAAQIQLQPQQLNELNVLLQQQALLQQLQQLHAQTQFTNSADDNMSTVDNKKPKLNFVLSSPATAPQFAGSLQQFGGTTGTQPQIQLQLLPGGGVSSSTMSSGGITAAQPTQQFNAAALLSSITGTQVVGGNAAVNMLSPNKCFLPITIRDENSDQQIVAHIDTKNLMLPTTYQVQMKLQPQLATADGQPIMQLTPTSIPATLQLTPQTPFHTATVPQQTQLLVSQAHQQHQQQPNLPQQQQTQQKPQQQLQQQPQKHQQQLAPTQAQVTSQQIIRSPRSNITNPQLVIRNVSSEPTTPTSNSATDASVIFKTPSPRQQPSQQQVKFKPTTSSVAPIGVVATSNNAGNSEFNKRVALLKQQPTTTSSNVAALQRLSSNTTITKLTKPQQSGASSKMPLLNKQNITISRISAQAPSKHEPKAVSTATGTSVVSALAPIPTASKVQSLAMPTLALQVTQSSTEVTSIANQRIINRKPPKQQPIQRTKAVRPQQQILPTPAQQATTQPQQEQIQMTNTLGSETPTSASAGGTPYLSLTCPTCLREFKKKEHLTQHVKLHAGLRPFKCTEDGCDKAFSRKEHLSRHLVSHSGQKMFTCEDCKKPFSRKDNLNKHKRQVHYNTNIIRLHCCEICNKNFASKQHYEKHRAMHKKSQNGVHQADKSQVNTAASAEPQTQPSQSQIHQQQQPQIMHVDLDGSTITITQASDSNMQTSLANFVQLGFSQFQNSSGPANQ